MKSREYSKTLSRMIVCAMLALMVSACCSWSRCSEKPVTTPDVLPLAACGDTTWNYGRTNTVREYRINLESLQNALDQHEDFVLRKDSEVSKEDLKQAIVLAADTWNEQANAGFFRYVGDTKRTWDTWGEDPRNPDKEILTGLPASALGDQGCDEERIDYSLVAVGPELPHGSAGVRCHRFRIAEQFRVGMPGHADRLEGFLGDPPLPNRYDFVKGVMHELGHTFDIAGHEVAAVMEGGKTGVNRSRDLYQRDLECLWVLAGNRNVRAYRVYQREDGTFSRPEVVSGGVQKASAGVRYCSGGTLTFTTTAIRDGSWLWVEKDRGMRIIGSLGSFDPRIGIMRQVVFREAPEIQRIFYSNWRDYPHSYQQDAKHRVQYVAFHADKPQEISTGPLYHCGKMTGDMSCSEEEREAVYSGKAVAVTFDEKSNRTVFAWVNQNRLSDDQSREIMVSIGYLSDDLLPEPDALGIQSNVTPGLACSDGGTGGHDCILAYVDAKFDDGRVRVRRFSTKREGNRYHVELESQPAEVTKIKTGSSLAAWYHSKLGRFYLAFRSSAAGQLLKVATSADGRNWAVLRNSNPKVCREFCEGVRAKKDADRGCCRSRYTITGPTVASWVTSDPNGKFENAIVWTSEM